MLVLILVILMGGLLMVGGHVYSGYLAKQFGEQPHRPTPAVQLNDGRDYVPTPTPVVFAHHFASIAGAGPIVGPVLALCYGWGPAMLWVVLGGLLIGGVHDYLATFMSTREQGQSIATIARRMLGRGPFLALMLFLVLMLGLVCATFLNLSATALTSTLSLAEARLDAQQTLFRTVGQGSEQQLVVGGIASTSVIIITALAPLIGWLYIKRQVSVWICSVLALGVCVLSIAVGLQYPVALSGSIDLLGWTVDGPTLWKIILAIYCLLAAGIPVWIFLQSRDFINVHILYVGMAFMVLALVVAGLRGTGPVEAQAIPMIDMKTGSQAMGMFWPLLFITIACGAVSGFHSLCAGGTTAKQLHTEQAARQIGFGAMMLESFLAVCVIGALMLGLSRHEYLTQVYPQITQTIGGASNPVLGFALAVGMIGQQAFGISPGIGILAGMILLEGFLVTTLDTAVRLMRYLLEEVWTELLGADHFLARYYWINSGLAVGIMLWFAFSGSILKLWSLFATSNQLLAAMGLGLGAIWLLRRGGKVWYVVWPAIFMLVTTFTSLILLLMKFMPKNTDFTQDKNITLFAADLLLIVLTSYLVVIGVMEAWRLIRHPVTAAPEPAGK